MLRTHSLLFLNSFSPNADWSSILEIDRSFTLRRPKILILGKFRFIPLRHLLRHLKFSSHGSPRHTLYTKKKSPSLHSHNETQKLSLFISWSIFYYPCFTQRLTMNLQAPLPSPTSSLRHLAIDQIRPLISLYTQLRTHLHSPLKSQSTMNI